MQDINKPSPEIQPIASQLPNATPIQNNIPVEKEKSKGIIIMMLIFTLVLIVFGVVGFMYLIKGDLDAADEGDITPTSTPAEIQIVDTLAPTEITANVTTPELIDPYEGWETYIINPKDHLLKAQINYPNDWIATTENSVDDYAAFETVVIKNKSNAKLSVTISRIVTSELNIICQNVKEETKMLDWIITWADSGETEIRTKSFETIEMNNMKLYAFKSFDRPDHVLMDTCDNNMDKHTIFGIINLTLPEEYSDDDFNLIKEIVSSLKLANNSN